MFRARGADEIMVPSKFRDPSVLVVVVVVLVVAFVAAVGVLRRRTHHHWCVPYALGIFQSTIARGAVP
jgi:hypothetical protein